MKRVNLFVVLTFTIALGCKTGEKTAEQTATADSAATIAQTPASAAATLTDTQKAEGWKLLFDGQTLTGWRSFKNAENNSWEAVDGTIHCKPPVQADKRADLMTIDQFENFELAFEWKISAAGNSGVMYRVTEDQDRPYYTGPEYQILDDGGYPGETAKTNFTASNYAMQAPVNKTLNPVGEWNTAKIIVNGKHVEHWLNGTKVVEYELGSDEWKKQKAASKWKDVDTYGMATKGHIDLQDHDHEVWFRNIMIKTL